MDDNREQLIRKRAYWLWEKEGRPEGRHEHHWQQASQDFGDKTRSQQQQGAPEEQAQQGDMGSQAPSEGELAREQQQG